jgi:hypothetical protein
MAIRFVGMQPPPVWIISMFTCAYLRRLKQLMAREFVAPMSMLVVSVVMSNAGVMMVISLRLPPVRISLRTAEVFASR